MPALPARSAVWHPSSAAAAAMHAGRWSAATSGVGGSAVRASWAGSVCACPTCSSAAGAIADGAGEHARSAASVGAAIWSACYAVASASDLPSWSAIWHPRSAASASVRTSPVCAATTAALSAASDLPSCAARWRARSAAAATLCAPRCHAVPASFAAAAVVVISSRHACATTMYAAVASGSDLPSWSAFWHPRSAASAS